MMVVIVLVYNNTLSEVNQLPSFVLHFNIISLLDTQYIYFYVLVAWQTQSLLTELPA